MSNKALIVDDVKIDRDMLYEILKGEYEVIQAENGRQAIEIMEKEINHIAVILLDLLMPVMDGYGVLKEMERRKWHDRVPVLVITGENHIETEEKCFAYGVTDFIRKPYYDKVIQGRVRNVVHLFQYRNSLEEKVHQQTVILKKQNQLLHQQTEKLKNSHTEIIDILGTVVESRNLESGEHIRHVKGFSRILAEKVMELYPIYGLTPENVEMISAASALHDIGKIAIPDHILLKPGKLTTEEFEYMKSHTLRGCEILDNIKNAWDEEYSRYTYDICRYHHERYDGRGYPDGLVGDKIPISAQIVSIADVYDALISERVYKSAYSKEDAFHMIITGECGMFSPRLLECFRKSQKEFERFVDRPGGA